MAENEILDILLLLLKFNCHSFSQKIKEEEIFIAVEKQAEYPGGMTAFGKFLLKIKWTPGDQNGKPVRSRFTIPINTHCYE